MHKLAYQKPQELMKQLRTQLKRTQGDEKGLRMKTTREKRNKL